MGEKLATRVAYGRTLAKLGYDHPEIVALDADLACSTMSQTFGDAHPDRFFNMGIAEANMIGVAAGLAAAGKKPYASSFAMFAAGRAFEQIRNSVAYPRLNVKIVGSHGGLSVGEDGATHQCCEDFALMRCLPGMVVCCPCDAYEMEQAVKALVDYEGPAYLRLGRLAVETVTDTLPNYSFTLGKGTLLREGKDVTIIANGMMVQKALKAGEILAAEGIDARIIDMHTVKPIDEEMVLQAAKETGAIVVSEEHNIVGGLGEAVAGYLSGVCPVPVIRHGVEDVFGCSGKAEKVLEYFGLSPEGIAAKARQAVEAKRK